MSQAEDFHIALLRGINVGGKNLLPMKGLVELFRAASCTYVQSYIQSGNVIFRAPAGVAERIPALVASAISERYGFGAPVVTRTAAEFEQIAVSNPFLRTGADPKTLHVAFFQDSVAQQVAAALDPHRSPPDEFAVSGREIYLHCPNGLGRSRFTTQYFDTKLGTTTTVRNWNTVLALLDLARVAQAGGGNSH